MDITVKKRRQPAECAVPLRLHKRRVYLTPARVHLWGDDMTGTLEARQDAGRRVQSAVKHLQVLLRVTQPVAEHVLQRRIPIAGMQSRERGHDLLRLCPV
jgi:hypothetical protein